MFCSEPKKSINILGSSFFSYQTIYLSNNSVVGIQYSCARIIIQNQTVHYFHLLEETMFLNKILILTANILLSSITSAERNLELCSKPTKITKLCKKEENYKANSAPKPWPVNVTPIINIKDVLEIDQVKKSMTIYVYLITYWLDPEVYVHTPNGEEYVILASFRLHVYHELNAES